MSLDPARPGAPRQVWGGGGVGGARPSSSPSAEPAPPPCAGKSGPSCRHCRDDESKACRVCACHLCGGKQDPDKQLLCDECDMAFHTYCLRPPLSSIPKEDEW